MLPRLSVASLIFVFGFGTVWAKPAPKKTPDFTQLKPGSIARYAGAEVLLVGKVVQVIPGPVGLSEPPLYTYTLKIAPEDVLRGSVKGDGPLTVAYSVRQKNEPTFPGPNDKALVALKFVRKTWVLQSVEAATPDSIRQAELATSFPLGWTIRDGMLVSPWAGSGKPGKAKAGVCAVTGRPVLVAGGGVRFSVEPVPPAKQIKFGNPDGDGEYRLTVKNATDREIEVPALLTDGKSIRWNESIVIRCQNRTYPIPGATGKVDGLKPVVLKPGETVSGTTHVFALVGPNWPKGGYRIEFQFCLGEKSATQTFYYLSRHHDPIRAAVQKGRK